MHLNVKLDRDGSYRWTMLASREDPRPVAQGANGCTDPGCCQDAALRMLGAGPEEMLAVQDADGQWRWVVNDTEGHPVAQSPTTFATAAACGYALHEVRHALGLGLARKR